ncbi:ankyrin repeat and SOCS box protein 13-like [Etheostoma cragini]|uniref:ankyrin repeat and SOCS box protein 13-like n=1 Tax=Etheostoma cragini TaxID=417921 RepID=UPI00155F398A|nr:ankyrin repeat and SOCS box protein 13-like [Etheostoma cragini]
MDVTAARRSFLCDIVIKVSRTFLTYLLHDIYKRLFQVDVRTIHGSTPLCHACASGSLECVELLLEYGANVNPALTALTASPLHEACIQGNVDVVRLMIASGARLEAYDVHFGPPLHVACAKGHVDCVKELLHAGQQDGCRSLSLVTDNSRCLGY